MPSRSDGRVMDRTARSGRATRATRTKQILTLVFCACCAFALPGCSGCEQIVHDAPQSQPIESAAQHSDDSTPDLPKNEPVREPVTAPTQAPETVPAQAADRPRADGASPGTSSSAPGARPVSVSSKQGSGHPSPASRTSATPDAAFGAAVALRDKAASAAGSKNYGSAFDYASQAWETAAAWPHDARLRKLAEELAAELKQLGAQANSKASAGSLDANKKLIDR